MLSRTYCWRAATTAFGSAEVTVMLMVLPPIEVALDNGMTASGPASPIMAMVGPVTMPPSAMVRFLVAWKEKMAVWGGEPTVKLPQQPGRGGRAQQLALAAACWLAGHDDLLLLAAGTDGSDGNSEDAGALVDGGTVDRGAADGLDPDDCLRRADAGTFLEDSGDLLYTGPTGTNVGDVVLALRRSGNRVRDLLE